MHFPPVFSGTGPPGRGVPPLSGLGKPPPYNITQPSANIDINTVLKPSVTHKAKVLYDYDASEDDELSLLADEVGCLFVCFFHLHYYSV